MLYIDTERKSVVIRPKGSCDGLGGEYIKPRALANVRAFYNLLNPNTRIIGRGGVRTGKDAFEYLLCATTMLQVCTKLCKKGVSIFERLERVLKGIMARK